MLLISVFCAFSVYFSICVFFYNCVGLIFIYLFSVHAAIFSVNLIYHYSRYHFLRWSSIWCFEHIPFTDFSHDRLLPTGMKALSENMANSGEFSFPIKCRKRTQKIGIKILITAYSPPTWKRFVKMSRRPRSECRNIIKEDLNRFAAASSINSTDGGVSNIFRKWTDGVV